MFSGYPLMKCTPKKNKMSGLREVIVHLCGELVLFIIWVVVGTRHVVLP